MGYKIAIVCLLALASGLVLTDAWLGFRNYRYSQLIAQHECGYPSERVCRGDFDGDGQFTEIRVQYRHDTPVQLPPRFRGTEAKVVLNAFSMDNTFRTHLGIKRESNRDRLIVYDGRIWPDTKGAVNSVYERSGNRLVETSATELDQEILAAMASRDDTGTLVRWVAYSVLAWPTRIVYTFLFLSAAFLYRAYRPTLY